MENPTDNSEKKFELRPDGYLDLANWNLQKKKEFKKLGDYQNNSLAVGRQRVSRVAPESVGENPITADKNKISPIYFVFFIVLVLLSVVVIIQNNSLSNKNPIVYVNVSAPNVNTTVLPAQANIQVQNTYNNTFPTNISININRTNSS
jgi:hypothetical protein